MTMLLKTQKQLQENAKILVAHKQQEWRLLGVFLAELLGQELKNLANLESTLKLQKTQKPLKAITQPLRLLQSLLKIQQRLGRLLRKPGLFRSKALLTLMVRLFKDNQILVCLLCLAVLLSLQIALVQVFKARMLLTSIQKVCWMKMNWMLLFLTLVVEKKPGKKYATRLLLQPTMPIKIMPIIVLRLAYMKQLLTLRLGLLEAKPLEY